MPSRLFAVPSEFLQKFSGSLTTCISAERITSSTLHNFVVSYLLGGTNTEKSECVTRNKETPRTHRACMSFASCQRLMIDVFVE